MDVLLRTQWLGECDAGTDDPDRESADVGTGHSGGIVVFSAGAAGKRLSMFDGSAACGGSGGVEGTAPQLDRMTLSSRNDHIIIAKPSFSYASVVSGSVVFVGNPRSVDR